MSKKFNRTLVTCALPYANGPVHIGHLAGVYVPADIYVRYLRMKGEDVLYVCGSDEHGVPITIKAQKETSWTDTTRSSRIHSPDSESTSISIQELPQRLITRMQLIISASFTMRESSSRR